VFTTDATASLRISVKTVSDRDTVVPELTENDDDRVTAAADQLKSMIVDGGGGV
jgi:hypothetical protein